MNDLRQYLIDEFVGEYLDAQMSRREALKRLTAITGSMASAVVLLAACAPQTVAPPSPTSAPAATATVAPAGPGVSPDDAAIVAERVQFQGKDGVALLGYAARPKTGGPFPLVLVCHENQGITEHINDVTRRAAKSGYAALAVDLLSRQGGTEKATAAGPVQGVFGNTNAEQFVQDFQSGLQYLQGQSYARKDRAGMVGFCFGGGITWLVATKIPELKAAVPFYGPNPPLEDVPGIQAAVLGIYGETDRFVNPGIPEIEAKMKESNKVYEKIIYPGAGHGFHNETAGSRYNAEAARDAWAKTIAWFDKHLCA